MQRLKIEKDPPLRENMSCHFKLSRHRLRSAQVVPVDPRIRAMQWPWGVGGAAVGAAVVVVVVGEVVVVVAVLAVVGTRMLSTEERDEKGGQWVWGR